MWRYKRHEYWVVVKKLPPSLCDMLRLSGAAFFQPSFKYHITAIADTPIKEHLYAVGVDVGLRWYIK